MFRKWIVFALSAGVLVSIAGAGFSFADDEDSELHKVMEKVNKETNVVKKGIRTLPTYKKAQKDVAKGSKALVKLAKEAKPLKDALSKAKNESNPQKKWDELMDAFIDSSGKLNDEAGKTTPVYDDVKKAYTTMYKTCTECHTVFRIEENF
jgi:cytochrome c556